MKSLRRILLVEDSVRDAELALDALAAHNLANEVIVLQDGAEALDYLFRRGAHAGREDTQPVVIMLDLRMPKVDGIEVLRQVKSDPKLRQIPVVVMTASREEQDQIRSYQLGVNAYVLKPLNFTDLVEAVKQVGCFWALLNEPPPARAGSTAAG